MDVGSLMNDKIKAGMAVALVLLFACSADAQLLLKLRMEHDQVMRFEDINAFVSVFNEGTIPVVFGDEGAQMSFRVEKERDVETYLLNEDLLWRGLTLEPGRNRDFMHDLSFIYDMAATGNYVIQAVVKWRGSEFESKRVRIDVVNGLPIHSERKVFSGQNDYARVLSLRYLSRAGGEHLFFCVDDDSAGMNYGVFDLGRIIRLHAPALRVKRSGEVRVLHQSGVGRFTLSHLKVSDDRVTFIQHEYRRADGSPEVKPEQGAAEEPPEKEEPPKRRFFFFKPKEASS